MKPLIIGLRSLWLVLTAVLLLTLTASALASPSNPFSMRGNQNIELIPADSSPREPIVDAAQYAGLEIAIESARVVPAEAPARPIVVVDIVVASSIGQQVRLPGRMVSLYQEDVRLVGLDRFEFAPSKDKIVLDAGEELRVAAVFKLAPHSVFELEDLSMHVSEPGRWPAVLPLDGSAPLAVSLPQPDLALSVGGATANERDLAAVSVQTTLDYGTYRSPSGQYLAVFTVESTPSADAPGEITSPFEGRDAWTVLIDGDARHASRVTKSKARDTAVVTYEVVFAYPSDSDELNLTVGDRLSVAVADLTQSK